MEIIAGTNSRAFMIARELPDHFTGKALNEIGSSEGEILIASDEGEDLGFLTYRIDDAEAEIEWMGIRKESQGKGIGTLLIRKVESILGKRGIRRIAIRTLDESVGYDPYSGTNAFFRMMGFVKVRTEEIPGWDPGNLCAIYEKAIL